MINSLVGQRYEVLEKVGESALFAVYKARDRSSGKVVALKSVQPAFASDAEFVTSLRSSLVATAGLNHPNVDKFIEFAEEDGSPFCVAEFVRGINLKERIRRIAPFTLSVTVDFACSICDGLHYSHNSGQPHGDLRPQNVIISPEGALKITDFGVQRAIVRSTEAQRATAVVSAPYRAPELTGWQAGTAAGDIYAVGCMLYEMLTGAPPFIGETPEATANQHAIADIPSPRTLNPGVPRSVEGIILKCLQKRPEYRYRSAAELLADLKSVRDALRFGKPLSWSPADTDPAITATAPQPAAPLPVAAPPAPKPRAAEQDDTDYEPMTKKNRLRAADERVSIYIKMMIGIVMAIIVTCCFGLVGIYLKYWVLPPPVAVPAIVGKQIDDVRVLAVAKGLRLIEHGEYTDEPRGKVYKSDYDLSHKLRPGQTINVWYSKGSAYVQVPKVEGLDLDLAEKRLKDAGLQLGNRMTQNSATVVLNEVISQNPSYRKRVLHDTPVSLVVSDGPKADYNNIDTPATEENNEAAPTPDAGGQPGDNTTTNGGGDTGPHGEPKKTFNYTIGIPANDHLGLRQVRIEYQDLTGWHGPVIDELHDAGDKIPIQFDYFGDKVTLRIFYDGRHQTDMHFPRQTNGRG